MRRVVELMALGLRKSAPLAYQEPSIDYSLSWAWVRHCPSGTLSR